MSKKKKAKKRKITDNDDSDSPEKETTRNDLHPTKKQKLTESSSSSSNDVTAREDSNQLTSNTKSSKQKKKKRKQKKEKKKRKKKAKSAPSNKPDADDGVDSIEGNHSSQVNLEGMMVDDQMVLVDRSKNVVYSTNEKLENCEYKQIGTIGIDGQIIITSHNHDKEEPSAQPQDFPFVTDPDDHCETPLVAYENIVPFLSSYSKANSIPSSSLFFYDPYYCNFGVANHLKSLGYPNVYNRKEDCYQVWSDHSRYPAHDILVTNPPYSGDHIEKLVKHVTSPAFGNRPWMLLLPQWVHKKDYYIELTKHIRPFYLIPHKRYVYVPPPDFRQAKKSDVHKKSSPFVSMWFIWGGTMQQNERWISKVGKGITSCDVARSKSALRDLRRKGAKKK